jgi:hypothetical protein
MRKLPALLLFLLLAPAAQAQNRVWQYIKTHKIVLTADAALILARAANAASSVHCQSISRGCVEENSTIGKHPSPTATWGYAMGSAAILVTANHTWWWATGKWDEKDLRPLMFLWNGPLVIVDGITTLNNVHDAEFLERQKQARARLVR